MTPDQIQFPIEFPLKVVCTAGDDLADLIGELITRHASGFDSATISIRESGKGKYHSLTCTITATSREQLDGLYRELHAHPRVKFVL